MTTARRLLGAVLTLASVAGLIEAAVRGNYFLLVATGSLLLLALLYLGIAKVSLVSAQIYYRRLQLVRLLGPGPLSSALRQALRVDGYQDRLSLLSLNYARTKNLDKPLVAPVRVLARKSYWPTWAFNIAVTFGSMSIRRIVRGRTSVARLEVTIDDSTAGIYNNLGKTFLNAHFSNLDDAALEDLSDVAYRATLPQPLDAPSSVTRLDPRIPLRWASGGALVIATWRGRKWVVLLFREIDPIGWNVANGASESPAEHFDLQRLAFRELSEELIVLDGNPTEGHPVRQRSLVLPWTTTGNDPLRSNQFSATHRSLREEHDGLLIDPAVNSEDGCRVDVISTDMEVLASSPRHAGQVVRNTIFSINPREHGVEVLLPIHIALNDTDFLLDGEIIDELGGIPARRPIMLLSIDHLRREYEAEGQIGQPASLERRILTAIPSDDHFLFLEDLKLRKRRLQNIRRALDPDLRVEPSTNEGDNAISILLQLPLSQVEREAQFHNRWLRRYESGFTCGGLHDSDLRTLCPATWKSIETALRNQYI